jgi:hypothetical protein
VTMLLSRTLMLASVLLGASSCGDPKNPLPKFRLEGSLTQVMDLGYDEARILRAPEDIALLFVRIKPLGDSLDGGTAGTAEEYPFRVAYRFPGDEPPQGPTVLDLTALDENNNQRGVAQRNVTDDPRNAFPEIKIGEVKFDAPLTEGKLITGSFHITFVSGTETASGRTCFAKTFTARVQP